MKPNYIYPNNNSTRYLDNYSDQIGQFEKQSHFNSLEFLMAFRNLKRRKLRTALTTLGIIIGVTAIVALNTICDALESEIPDINIVRVFLLSIAGISLLVAGIGIMNTMLMSTMERKREIGILKSIGTSKKRILRMFMIESGFIGVTGGIIGCILGITVLRAIELFARIYLNTEPESIPLSWSALIFGLFFAVSMSMFFGLYPSWKAAKLKPIEALRYA